MRASVFAFTLVAFAGVASARPVVLVSQPVNGAAIQAIDSRAGGSNDVVNMNYDNWTNPGSLLNGLFTVGGAEIADDLNMTPTGAGLLDSMGLNVANMQPTGGGIMVTGAGTVRFYNQLGGAFVGGFNFNLPAALNLPAQSSSRIQFGAGALTGLGIFLPQNIFCSLQYTSVTYAGAGGIADVGLQTRGPINIGTSTDNMINVTTNSSFNFGGNPLANTGLFIRTNDVPAPGSLALLSLGGLLAARRRR